MPLLAKCHFALLAINCEAQHYQAGVDAGNLGLEIHFQIGEPPPSNALANLAVAYMNVNDTQKAITFFERVLNAYEFPAASRFHVLANYSICLRRGGRLRDAAAMYERALAEADHEAIDPEALLELALSGAKIAELFGDVTLLTVRLHEVVKHLDGLLDDVLRLHHRRGLRARYFWRIEEMLYALPSSGLALNVLSSLLALRGNAMGDWLTILAWASRVRKDPSINLALIKQMDAALLAIRDIGAPHLFGKHEESDDAWSQSSPANVWDDLSHVAALINADCTDRPLDQAGTIRQTSLCQTRLSQNHCLMMLTFSKTEALLWYFIGEQYKRVAIPLAILKIWGAAQLDHAQQFVDRNAFIAALQQLVDALHPTLDAVFNDISDSACRSVRYLEGQHNDLPLMAFALRNANLARRMQDGGFEIRTVPAVVEQAATAEHALSSPVSITDPYDDLPLAPYEAAAFTRSAGIADCEILHTDGKGSLLELLIDYDTLIVSTHGHSLKFFEDAYFAHLGNPNQPHLIRVSTVQAAAPDLRIRMALLNTCYSGSRSARNHLGQFKTSDTVAIPNLFLLNRQAVAMAGTWKVFDIVSFIISHLVGEGVKLGLEPSAAMARAIARLGSIPTTDVKVALKDVVPLEVLTDRLASLDNAPEKGIFAAPYHTAGLAIHGLL